MKILLKPFAVVITTVALSACQVESGDTTVDNSGDSPQSAVNALSTHGKNNKSLDDYTTKIQPPVRVDYKLLGTPAVGEPLEIEITVSSAISDRPVQVNYRAADNDALRFLPRNGTEQSFKLDNLSTPGKRTIVVVPQREGRNLFTVTTELEMPDGVMANSKAIAIDVGTVTLEKKVNGELVRDERGETVISMPAN